MNYSQESTMHIAPRGKRVVGAVAGLALAGAVANYVIHEKHESDEHKTVSRVEALKKTDSILDKVILIKAGAQLRLTPQTLNGTPDNGEPNNIEHVVPKNKMVVVRLAEMADKSHPGWIAFADPNTDFSKIHTMKDRANHTVWANYSELTKQGYIEDTGYQSVSGKPVNTFSVNPLEAHPQDATLAASIEVDERAASIAKFVVTGARQ